MSIFGTTTNTPQTKVATQIDNELRLMANAMLGGYNKISALINTNRNFKDEYGTYDPDAVYAAWLANTTSGMSTTQLQHLERAVKTLVNYVAPGKIVDATVQATITYP